jgi:hypothetical protein
VGDRGLSKQIGIPRDSYWNWLSTMKWLVACKLTTVKKCMSDGQTYAPLCRIRYSQNPRRRIVLFRREAILRLPAKIFMS